MRLALEAHDIESRPTWKPLHLQPAFAGVGLVGPGRCAEIFDRGLCLPTGSALSPADQSASHRDRHRAGPSLTNGMTDRMKILIVASDFPWPQIQGGHLRLATAIEALAGLGETDLFALYDDRRTGTHPAPNGSGQTAQDGGAPRNPAPAPLADRHGWPGEGSPSR